MSSQTITLTIPGSLDNLGPLGTSIRALAGTLGVDEEAAFSVELAAVEATTNAIRHALKDEPEGWVSMKVELDTDHMVLTLRNPGRALDPGVLERASMPTIGTEDGLDALPEGGMGLALIREVMSEVEYRRTEGLNEIRMVFSKT